MRGLAKNIKRLIILAVLLVLIGIVGIAFYLVYLDSNTYAAKNYLVKTYGLEEKEIKPKKYIKYVYEDLVNCDEQWFKKCTNDENLEYEYIFLYNDKEIIVSQDKKGLYFDNSGFEPLDNDNEDVKNNS